MRYSYELKKQCVQWYREGRWEHITEGISEELFHKYIRFWTRLEVIHGPEILKHDNNISLAKLTSHFSFAKKNL